MKQEGKLHHELLVARASVVTAELHRLRDRLKKELPGLRRMEIDIEYEDGKLTQRVKLEVRV